MELDLPMPVQTITPSLEIAATTGCIALRRGPLVYNLERVDQEIDSEATSALDPGVAPTADGVPTCWVV
jgi:DUF1680 family protein